eukprot:566748-Amphidinium_carterae.2
MLHPCDSSPAPHVPASPAEDAPVSPVLHSRATQATLLILLRKPLSDGDAAMVLGSICVLGCSQGDQNHFFGFAVGLVPVAATYSIGAALPMEKIQTQRVQNKLQNLCA